MDRCGVAETLTGFVGFDVARQTSQCRDISTSPPDYIGLGR